MKQVADLNGNAIDGMFRNKDGSLSLNNHSAYNKNKLQHDKFTSLTNEVNFLKEQMKLILEKLNG
jgi:hypothetical protein